MSEIIDAQLHEIGPRLDWQRRERSIRWDALTETLLASMSAVGVDGAVIQPVDDLGWASALAEREPDRFAVVPMLSATAFPGGLHPDDPKLEENVDQVCELPGVVGLRIDSAYFPGRPSPTGDAGPVESGRSRLERGGFDESFRICEEKKIPIFLGVMGYPELAARVASDFPKLTIVIDHMGVVQLPRDHDKPWWKKLPLVLELARFPNVSVKLCGAPSLSTEAFPFRDVWPQMIEMRDAYGADRLMWASDISRFDNLIGARVRFASLEGSYPGKHTYAESLAFIRDAPWLSRSEKEEVLGGAARRLLRWSKRASDRVSVGSAVRI